MTDDLAERIREMIGDHPHGGEIRMFGGICFTLNGNMLVGTMKDGELLARVGDAQEAEALARPGARRMNFTGREMKGFIMVAGRRARRRRAARMDFDGHRLCRSDAAQARRNRQEINGQEMT